jgi:hypothetical protein
MDLNGNLRGHLDYANQHQEELGWKLFVLRLSGIIVEATIRLAWLSALIWAFNIMLTKIK